MVAQRACLARDKPTLAKLQRPRCKQRGARGGWAREPGAGRGAREARGGGARGEGVEVGGGTHCAFTEPGRRALAVGDAGDRRQETKGLHNLQTHDRRAEREWNEKREGNPHRKDEKNLSSVCTHRLIEISTVRSSMREL